VGLCYSAGAMPRQPRLDAPEALRHVMARGLEGRAIFRVSAGCKFPTCGG